MAVNAENWNVRMQQNQDLDPKASAPAQEQGAQHAAGAAAAAAAGSASTSGAGVGVGAGGKPIDSLPLKVTLKIFGRMLNVGYHRLDRWLGLYRYLH